ncbi:hypothetical protein IWW36_005574, partial [Coemansia brasiliensis]
MSSRAVRRLMKERGHDDLEESAALIEKQARQIDSEEQLEKGQKATNLFDLLGESNASDSDHGSDSNSIKDSSSDRKEENSIARQEPAKKAGAKKKKGKKKGKKAATKAEDMSMKEFEAHLKELDEQLAPTADGTQEDEKKTGRGEALGVVLTEEQQQNRALLM